MPTRFGFVKGCAFAAAAFVLVSTGSAKMEQWTDTQGAKFKGEPAEAVGPFALFRLPDRSGKLVPFGLLTAQDCARFALGLRDLPRPADDWSQTKTKIGAEIYGSARRVEGDKLVDVELKGRPEPRFYVLFFVSNGEGKSWGTLGKTNWPMQDLQQKHPGKIEGFMVGVKHGENDQMKMATTMKVPYLVSKIEDQVDMTAIGKIAPAAGYGVVIANANGVPLYVGKCDTDESAKALFAQFGGLLDLLRPDNPRGWKDSLHYWTAAQSALHPADQCDPLLVGDPLNAAALRDNGVQAFEATIYVSAEGTVTGVKIAAGAQIPEALVQPISEALHQARLVPAVSGGRFVAGSLRYNFGK